MIFEVLGTAAGISGVNSGGTNTAIEGSTENLFKCPCCQYKTLDMRGEYEICPVCQWEDDGE